MHSGRSRPAGTYGSAADLRKCAVELRNRHKQTQNAEKK